MRKQLTQMQPGSCTASDVSHISWMQQMGAAHSMSLKFSPSWNFALFHGALAQSHISISRRVSNIFQVDGEITTATQASPSDAPPKSSLYVRHVQNPKKNRAS